MGDVLTMNEIISSIVRRGKGIVIFALVLAILAGGYQGYKQVQRANSGAFTAEALEAQYQEALKTYETEKGELERQLTILERRRGTQANYLENAPAMQIDPYNMYMSKVQMSVSHVDDGAFQQVFREQDIPVNYIINQIRTQYKSLLESVDLPSVLGVPEYENALDVHMREIIFYTESADGVMTITAYGTTAEMAETLAEATSRWMMDQQETIEEITFDHQISVISRVTKAHIDHEWVGRQDNAGKIMNDYVTEIAEVTAEMNALAVPAMGEPFSLISAAKKIVLFAVVGAVAGTVLACAWVFVIGLFQNRLETSYQLVRCMNVVFLGNVSKQKCFGKLASRLANERIWKDQEQAIAYAAENIKISMGEQRNVLLLSTRTEKELSDVQQLADQLKQAGYSARVMADARRDPAMVSALEEASAVVLAEKLKDSSLKEISDLNATVENCKKKIAGFVLI